MTQAGQEFKPMMCLAATCRADLPRQSATTTGMNEGGKGAKGAEL
jgi:hypothetical protein